MGSINLKEDSRTIYEHLKQRVAEYPVYLNNGPGADEDPISLITFGYSVDQHGWVALVFDTRPDAEHDGEWNDYIEDTWVEFPTWTDAVDAYLDAGEPIDLILPNGKHAANGQLVEFVGEMLKEILLKARSDGLFANLPLTEKCAISIEDQLGAYAWPDSEEDDDEMGSS